MRHIITIGISCAILPLSLAANAQQPPGQAVQGGTWPTPGIYLDLRGGGAFVTDSELNGPGTVNMDIEAEFDPGFMFEGAAGYDHPTTGWRGEVAVGWRSSDIDSLTITNDGGIGAAAGVGSLNGISTGVDGEVDAISFMGNGYYDFDLGGRFAPFVGAGVGVVLIDVNADAGGIKLADDEDSVFAYQGTAGVAYEINSFWTASAAYTCFAAEDADLRNTGGGQFDAEYDAHTIWLGIRLTNY